MFQKSIDGNLIHARQFSLFYIACAIFYPQLCTAQTIDELAQLQKKAQINAAAPMRLPPATVIPTQTSLNSIVNLTETPRQSKSPPPKKHQISVVSISGRSPSELVAQIYEPGWRVMQLTKGDKTSSGWHVESITPQAVTFSKPAEQGKPTEKLARGENKQEHGERGEQRVTIVLGGTSAAFGEAAMQLWQSPNTPTPIAPAPILPINVHR